MKNSALVLGGYGNFGKRISKALAAKGVKVLIAGRDGIKAEGLAREIGSRAIGIQVDVGHEIPAALKRYQPDVVVNTVGPFQGQGYDTARAAISQGVSYVDLADGRCFVCNIVELDELAKKAGVCVVSGASTVPALSDAVLAQFEHEFQTIDLLKYGISPGQRAERGLATTQGILSYVGRKLDSFPGIGDKLYGWQDLYRQVYPELGTRWMANCDIPDLDLLPKRYGIRSIQFSAGLELGVLHLGLWGLSHFVRLGLPLPLPKLAGPMLAISNWFNRFGSSDGGMHVILQGTKADSPGEKIERRWFIIARDGDGPHIPTIPAILLAERIAGGDPPPAGAYPCLGLISLSDYIAELGERNVETFTECRSVVP